MSHPRKHPSAPLASPHKSEEDATGQDGTENTPQGYGDTVRQLVEGIKKRNAAARHTEAGKKQRNRRKVNAMVDRLLSDEAPKEPPSFLKH